MWIVNNNNGERFDTYTIAGERGSGVVCLNGAAARKAQLEGYAAMRTTLGTADAPANTAKAIIKLLNGKS